MTLKLFEYPDRNLAVIIPIVAPSEQLLLGRRLPNAHERRET